MIGSCTGYGVRGGYKRQAGVWETVLGRLRQNGNRALEGAGSEDRRRAPTVVIEPMIAIRRAAKDPWSAMSPQESRAHHGIEGRNSSIAGLLTAAGRPALNRQSSLQRLRGRQHRDRVHEDEVERDRKLDRREERPGRNVLKDRHVLQTDRA